MTTLIPQDRILHMHGVAEYMYREAGKYQLDPERMYLLGLLHDVGYLQGTEGHEEAGAKMAEEAGYKDADLIRWHGAMPEAYMQAKGCDPSAIPKELLLLWEADLKVDHNGKDVGFQKRLEEIAKSLGKESKAYQECARKAEWLMKQCGISSTQSTT